MKAGASAALAQSVQARLVRHAKALDLDPNLVLARYAAERFLYRLSRSRHAERFVLKGALLLLVWLGETIRPTRDADLLGLGDLSKEALAETFAEICALAVEPDGLIFDLASIRVDDIRREDPYGGRRVNLLARLGPARLHLQVDVGIGDAVTIAPEWLDYPSMLDLPRPWLLAYHPETSIAEKVHAMVLFGAKNSRMRDFFDIYALAERQPFDGTRLAQALRATFDSRSTPIPTDLPAALAPSFAAMADKRAQWMSFLRKNRLTAAPEDLEQVMTSLAEFLAPVLAAAARGTVFESAWHPGGPWGPAIELAE